MIEVAKRAAELVIRVKEELKKEQKEEYLKAVRNLGPMIIQNGLAGAILFAKKKKWPEQLINHIDELIKLHTGKDKISKKIEDGSIFGNPTDYLQLQLAALESVRWLKRYSEITLGGEES